MIQFSLTFVSQINITTASIKKKLGPRAPGYEYVKQKKILYALKLASFAKQRLELRNQILTCSDFVQPWLVMALSMTLAGLPRVSASSKFHHYKKELPKTSVFSKKTLEDLRKKDKTFTGIANQPPRTQSP